ncbi:MAG: helix-turn-helix domain-containing protein [Solirubrobacteraceae bacterium]
MQHLLPVAVRASNGEHVVRVFEHDDELFAAVPANARDLAVRHGVARVRSLPIGTWEASAEDDAGALGLLILNGLILHDVRVGSVTCTELLARQDLLRPWDEDPELQPVPMETAWRVIAPARLAVLDRRFAVVAGRFPDVMATLLGRTMTRARGVVAMMSISHMHRVEARLEACLWYLADRFGRVTAEGVVLPLPLTHMALGRLVGAQRPSVTTALGELAEQGRVRRLPDGAYLLVGEPPAMRPRQAPGAGAPRQAPGAGAPA